MAGEVTLTDALAPLLNIMGGVAGATIIYGVVTIWQNKRKIARLHRLEVQVQAARAAARRVERGQQATQRAIANLDRKVNRLLED